MVTFICELVTTIPQICFGDSDFTYLNRNNWGKGGLVKDSEPEQWEDVQFGINFGWKVGKNIGILKRANIIRCGIVNFSILHLV